MLITDTNEKHFCAYCDELITKEENYYYDGLCEHCHNYEYGDDTQCPICNEYTNQSDIDEYGMCHECMEKEELND